MLMLSERLCPEDTFLPDSITDPHIYNLTNLRFRHPTPRQARPEWPSKNHAFYLVSTVKFHFGQTYRLFDESRFEREIRILYVNALPGPVEHRVWSTKLLMMPALETTFHVSSVNFWEPPGAKFFATAMALIPHNISLWKDSLLGIELLALAALYKFWFDQRESAYIFISVISYPYLFFPAFGICRCSWYWQSTDWLLRGYLGAKH